MLSTNKSGIVIASRSNLIVLGIIAIGICWFLLDRWLFNPKPIVLEEVQHWCRKQQGEVTSFDVLRIQGWEKGKLIVYQGVCQRAHPNGAPLAINGYKVWTWEGFNWLSCTGATGFSPMDEQPSSHLIQVFQPNSERCKYQNDFYTFVYGKILDPSVASVKARFSDGEVLQDNGKGDIFVFNSLETNQLCELQALDADGQVLWNLNSFAFIPFCHDAI